MTNCDIKFYEPYTKIIQKYWINLTKCNTEREHCTFSLDIIVNVRIWKEHELPKVPKKKCATILQTVNVFKFSFKKKS